MPLSEHLFTFMYVRNPDKMSAAERKLVAQSIEQCVVEEKLGKYFLVQEAFLQRGPIPALSPKLTCSLSTGYIRHMSRSHHLHSA